MKYIKIDKDIWVEYNEETQQSRTVVKSEIEAQVKMASERLSVIGEARLPSNKELLEWAKIAYQATQLVGEKEHLENQVIKSNLILEKLK